jgi:flagellar basal-body rod protein FlgG
MATIALNSSASGMNALNTRLDVIANNIANADTTAFKASRTNFQDLYYIERKQPGVTNQPTQSTSPIGLYVGLGTEVAGTQLDFTQGTAIPTNRQLDIMIEGDGFLQVDIGDQSNGIGYTRAGALALDQDGNLVMANDVGYRIEPNIVIPPQATNISIGTDGSVYYQDPAQVEPVLAGQLELAVFQNSAGLQTVGDNLYLETFASGPANVGNPGDPGIGAGRIVSGFLEGSNVDAVTQLVDLIRTQRAFEMNSQTFDAADQTLQTIVNLGR